MNTLAKLAEFEAKLDTVLFDSQEDESHPVKNVLKAGAAVGVGYGAYKGGKAAKNALTNRYGVTDDMGNVSATGDMIKKGIKKDVGDTAGRVKAIPGKFGDAFKSARAGASEGLGLDVLPALKSAAKRSVERFSEKDLAKRIIELDTLTDKIIELRVARQ
jgi:hypothetical protein